jgi:hypothetical protein
MGDGGPEFGGIYLDPTPIMLNLSANLIKMLLKK